MKPTYRIVVLVLVVLTFAAGWVARRSIDWRDERAALRRQSKVLTSEVGGTRVASAEPVGAANLDLQPLQTLLQVVTHVREQYVERITPEDENRMTYEAVKGMLRSLGDPNTRFLERQDRQIVQDALQGNFHGIGAWLAIKKIKSADATDEHLIVVAPMPGSPAEKAGLKPGDDIIAVDGKSVLGFDPFQRLTVMLKESRSGKADRLLLEKRYNAERKRVSEGIDVADAQDLLSREDDKKLELTVLSKETGKEAKVDIQPAAFTLDPVTSGVEADNYAYVKINCFCSSTGPSIDRAMRDLGGKSLKGLILDLRNVSGGSIDAALQVAKWFAPGKRMTTIARSRGRRTPLMIPVLKNGTAWNKPVVALVNGGTARTAEVLAAALKDLGIARLVGEKTYGDFGETTLIEQSDGSAVLLTTGAYLTSKGVSLSGKGLSADAAVASAASRDAVLKAAISALRAQP